MKLLFPAARAALVGSLLMLSSLAQAGITVEGTRVIMSAPAQEAAITVGNPGAQDVMIQSWLEAGDDAAASADLPFAITPSLGRLASGKQQTLRIFYQGEGLPTDRESVFWLSVQEIPPKAKEENTLQLAVRQRLKVFYRPARLTGTPEAAAQQIQWRLVESAGKPALEARNASAYHVSLVSATLDNGRYKGDTRMVAPGATEIFALNGAAGRPTGATVTYEVVNDYGGVTALSGALNR